MEQTVLHGTLSPLLHRVPILRGLYCRICKRDVAWGGFEEEDRDVNEEVKFGESKGGGQKGNSAGGGDGGRGDEDDDEEYKDVKGDPEEAAVD